MGLSPVKPNGKSGPARPGFSATIRLPSSFWLNSAEKLGRVYGALGLSDSVRYQTCGSGLWSNTKLSAEVGFEV